jgi:hypothetical protein
MLIKLKHEGYQAGIRLYPGKGGGSSATPPDPRLAEAQLKSMGIQDDAIKRMLSISEDMAPLQKEELKFGLESGRTAYEQSQADREWMLDRRVGLTEMQDSQLKDARDFNSDGFSEELAGRAQADVTSAFSSAQDQNTRGMSRMGVNPSSGKALALRNKTSIAQAAASADAANRTRTLAREEGYRLTDRAAGPLAGYPGMAMSTTGSGASYGSAGIGLANSGAAGLTAGASAAAGVAGQMGANASSMYGAQASYKNAQDQISNANDPWNTILGAAAGGAGAYGMSKLKMF